MRFASEMEATPGTVVLAGWVPFLASALTAIFCSAGYVIWLRSADGRRRCRLTSAAAVLALTTTLLTTALVPFDVFLVSSMKYSNGTFKPWAADAESRSRISGTVINIYYAFYGLTLAFDFLILPMAFFYHALGDGSADDDVMDDVASDDDLNDDLGRGHRGSDTLVGGPRPFGQRILRALKLVLAWLSFLVVLVLVGAFYPFPDSAGWVPKERFEVAAGLVINVLMAIGMGLLVVYTGSGMSTFPLTMIMGRQMVASSQRSAALADLSRQLADRQTRIREIEETWAGREELMTWQDQNELEELGREVRLIVRQKRELDQSSRPPGSNVASRLAGLLCRPFQFVLGVLACLLGFLVTLSLFLGNLDKALHSAPGKDGGNYLVLTNSTIPKPVDLLLVAFQSVYPLDYVLYLGIVLFFVVSTLAGLQRLGIRFFWLLLYKVKGGRTRPQALALMCFNLTFILLAVDVVMFTLLPEYTTYGDQYFNVTTFDPKTNSSVDEVKKCGRFRPDDGNLGELDQQDCAMTGIATLLLSFQRSSLWVFGAFYYYATWVLLVAVVVGAVVNLVQIRKKLRLACRPGLVLGGRAADDDDDDDEDEDSLINQEPSFVRDNSVLVSTGDPDVHRRNDSAADAADGPSAPRWPPRH